MSNLLAIGLCLYIVVMVVWNQWRVRQSEKIWQSLTDAAHSLDDIVKSRPPFEQELERRFPDWHQIREQYAKAHNVYEFTDWLKAELLKNEEEYGKPV